MLGNECPMEMFYSLKEIYKSAGESGDLRKHLDFFREGYFPNNSSFVQWWYSHNKILDASPDQLCKEGKQYELECLIMDIFTGAGGG